jgi:hypothetical protein
VPPGARDVQLRAAAVPAAAVPRGRRQQLRRLPRRAGPAHLHAADGPERPRRRLPQGTLAYTLDDAHHHVVRHLGACAFEPEEDNRRLADALAYVKAVGCRPGRQIAIPKAPDEFLRPAPGAVYGYYVHGGQTILVPRGTTVDLVVNRRPSQPAAY